jgi:hypothetical protein
MRALGSRQLVRPAILPRNSLCDCRHGASPFRLKTRLIPIKIAMSLQKRAFEAAARERVESGWTKPRWRVALLDLGNDKHRLIQSTLNGRKKDY